MMATFSNDDTFLERPTPTRVLFSNVSFVAIRFLFVKLGEIELKNICGVFLSSNCPASKTRPRCGAAENCLVQIK